MLRTGVSLLALCVAAPAAAQVAWLATPTDSDWNNGANWDSASPPTAADTAAFSTTTISDLDITANAAANRLDFDPDGPVYNFNIHSGATWTLGGSGGSSSVFGNITGAGAVTQDGAGSLQLFGTNDFAGPTTINGGTVIVFNGSAIGDASNVAVSSGGTFEVGNSETIGSLTGSGGVTLDTGQALTLATASTFTGVLTGDGGLTIAGSGTTILTKTNSYTGGTTIAAGTLQIGGGGTNGSITGPVLDNGTLAFDRSDDSTFDGAVSGSGGVTKFGAGILTVTGASTYGGATNVSAGTLQAGAANVFSAGSTHFVSPGATLDLNGFNQSIGALFGDGFVSLGSATLTVGALNSGNQYGGVMSGGGGLTKVGSGGLILTGANTYTGVTTISAGVLTIGEDGTFTNGGPTGSIASSSVVDNATLELNRSNSMTFSAAISGSGNVRQIGDGTATLTGANTYGGGTEIVHGTLRAGATNTLSASSAVTVDFGGALDINSFNQTIGSLAGGGVVYLGTGTLTTGGDNSSTTLSGTLGVGGTGNLIKTGTGVFTLSGFNTFNGTVVINGGTLRVGADHGIGGGAFTVASGATLDVNNINSDIGSLAGAGNVTLGSGVLGLGTDNSSTTFSGAISGTGGVQMGGNGVFTLSGTNTYTGDTHVIAGTIRAGAVNAFAPGSTQDIVNGGILDLNGFNQTISRLIDTGLVTLGSANLTLGVDNPGDNSGDFSFQGRISGSGGLTKVGTDVFTLATTSGSITYTGATNVNAGTLRAGHADVFAVGSAHTVASGATLDLDSFNQTIGSLAGAGSVTLGSATLTTGGNNSSTTFSGGISGTGGLTKAGSGTLILSGSNSYTGLTGIAGGTLQIGDGGTSGSLASTAISNVGTLVFNRSDSVTLGGVVSGSGALVQAGTGTTVLTADNTYGGATTISAGTLQLGAGGTSGSISSTSGVTDNGTLAFDRSDSVTFGAAITGSGSLVQAGSGTTILTGANSYGGGTTISAGTLQIGNGGTSGSITGPVLDNGTLVFNRSDDIAFGGAISGAGSLTKLGAGILTVSGGNTYSGVTNLSAGTLQAGAVNVFSSASTHVLASGATLDLNNFNQTIGTLSGAGFVTLGSGNLNLGGNNSSSTYSGVISGSGALTKAGSGTLILAGDNAYTGGTTISAGTLQIGAGGTSGSIIGDVLDNGILAFNRSDDLAFAGVISGSGGLSQLGPDTLTLTGANTYTGDTVISGGTLQVGNGGTSGAIGGDVSDGGVLAFNRSDNIAFGGVISGAGSLTKAGTNTLTLTGANTYAGGTVITGGTLQVGSGGATGAIGGGNVSDGGALVFNRSDDIAYGGAISGAGSLTKLGAGALTLSGDNSFSGPTTVSSGNLVLLGSLAGPTTVASGAILSGRGTAGGAVTVQSGATLSPGSGIGTITVGSLTTAGTLKIEFSGHSGGDTSDKVLSLGAVNITGGAVDAHPTAVAGNYLFDTRYRIIASPAAVTGTFSNPAGFTDNPYETDLKQRLRYDSSGVILEIRRVIDFTVATSSSNQAAVAGALNSSELGADDTWADLLNSFASLSADDQRRALDLMGGEGLADASQLGVQGIQAFMDVIHSHMGGFGAAGSGGTGQVALAMLDAGDLPGGRSGVLTQLAATGGTTGLLAPAPAARRGVWVEGFGLQRDLDGASGLANTRSRLAGVAVGADGQFGETLGVGIAGGYSAMDSKTPDRLTKADGEAFYLAAYGRAGYGNWFGGVTAAYSHTSLNQTRTVGITGAAAASKPGVNSYGASGLVAYRIGLHGGGELQPTATVNYAHSRQGGYTETAAGGLSLVVAPLTTDQVTATLGGRWLKPFQTASATVTPELSGGAAFQSGDRAGLTRAVFSGAPGGGGFAVTGAAMPSTWAYVGAGMTVASASDKVAVKLGYQGAFASRLREHQLAASVQLRW